MEHISLSTQLRNQTPSGWYRLGSLAELSDQTPVRIEFPDRAIGATVLHGAPTAFPDECPHMGASFAAGHSNGRSLTCGFHGFSFSRDTSTDRPPALCGRGLELPTIPTWVEHDVAYAYMGDLGATDEVDDPSFPSFSVVHPFAAAQQAQEAGFASQFVEMGSQLEAHPMIVLEGDFDLGHFPSVHGIQMTPVAHSFEPEIARVTYQEQKLQQRLTVEIAGLSQMRQVVERGEYRFYFHSDYLPLNDRSCTVVTQFAATGPEQRALDVIVGRMMKVLVRDAERDARIWRGRSLDVVPKFREADEMLRAFRLWASKFVPGWFGP